jgi:hypothetical protein
MFARIQMRLGRPLGLRDARWLGVGELAINNSDLEGEREEAQDMGVVGVTGGLLILLSGRSIGRLGVGNAMVIGLSISKNRLKGSVLKLLLESGFGRVEDGGSVGCRKATRTHFSVNTLPRNKRQT